MDIRGIGYLGFESPNIDAWRSYGPEVLGLAIAPSPDDEPDALYLRMDDRRYRFAFQPGPIDKLTYIGWECVNRIAFEKAIRKLQDSGIAVEQGSDDLKMRRAVRDVVRFKDPVGYQYELFYGQKASRTRSCRDVGMAASTPMAGVSATSWSSRRSTVPNLTTS